MCLSNTASWKSSENGSANKNTIASMLKRESKITQTLMNVPQTNNYKNNLIIHKQWTACYVKQPNKSWTNQKILRLWWLAPWVYLGADPFINRDRLSQILTTHDLSSESVIGLFVLDSCLVFCHGTLKWVFYICLFCHWYASEKELTLWLLLVDRGDVCFIRSRRAWITWWYLQLLTISFSLYCLEI